MPEIVFFDKVLTANDLKTIPVGQPIGLIYTSDFGIPSADIINYVQSLGGITSLSISPLLPFKEKQTIIKNYLDYGEYINSPTLFSVCLTLFKSYKNVNEDVLESDFLTFNEIIILTNEFKKELKVIDKFFSSLFYIMYFMGINKLNDCSQAKQFYPADFIKKDITPDFFKHLLQYPNLFDLYKLRICDNPVFYTDLYEFQKDKINKLLLSDKNYLLKTINSLECDKHLAYLMKR